MIRYVSRKVTELFVSRLDHREIHQSEKPPEVYPDFILLLAYAPIYIPFTSHLHPIYFSSYILWGLNTHSSWSTPHSIDRGFSSPSVVGWRPNLSVKIRLNLLDTSIYMWDMYRYVSCTSLLGYFETYTNIASVSWINLFVSWDFSWFFINHSWPSPEDGSIGWYCVLLSMTW